MWVFLPFQFCTFLPFFQSVFIFLKYLLSEWSLEPNEQSHHQHFQQNWFRCSQGCQHLSTCMFSPPVSCYCGVAPGHEKHQVDMMRRETTYFSTSLRGVLVTTAGDHFFIIFSKMVYRSIDKRKFQGQCWQCLVHDRNKIKSFQLHIS